MLTPAELDETSLDRLNFPAGALRDAVVAAVRADLQRRRYAEPHGPAWVEQIPGHGMTCDGTVTMTVVVVVNRHVPHAGLGLRVYPDAHEVDVVFRLAPDGQHIRT